MTTTLADHPEAAQPFLVFPDEPFHECASVFAPCCGRRTCADAVLDVRGVSGTVVRAGNRYEALDHDWLCCGCRALLIADRSNSWTPSALAAATGARPETIHSLTVAEARDKAVNQAHAARRSVDQEAEYRRAQANAALPA